MVTTASCHLHRQISRLWVGENEAGEVAGPMKSRQKRPQPPSGQSWEDYWKGKSLDDTERWARLRAEMVSKGRDSRPGAEG